MAQAIYSKLVLDQNQVDVSQDNSHSISDYFGYISKSNQYPEPKSYTDFDKLVDFADIVWLCIKPQQSISVLSQLKKTYP